MVKKKSTSLSVVQHCLLPPVMLESPNALLAVMDVTTPVCKQPPTLMSLSSPVIRETKFVLSLGAGMFKI